MSIFTTGSVSPPRSVSGTPTSECSFGRQSLRPHEVDIAGPMRAHSLHITSDYGSTEGTHVQQCIRCLHYGHDRCRRKPRCFRCGSFEHVDSASCSLPFACLNCGGPHHSRHPDCPSRLRELTIQQLVHKQGLCRREAVQMAASFGVDRVSGRGRRLRTGDVTAKVFRRGEDYRSFCRDAAVQTDPPPVEVATQTEAGINASAMDASPITPIVSSCWGYSVYPCYPVQVLALGSSFTANSPASGGPGQPIYLNGSGSTPEYYNTYGQYPSF